MRFFADQRVFGEGDAQFFNDELLGGHIVLGDQIRRAFVGDFFAGNESLAHDGAGFEGNAFENFDAAGVMWGIHFL